MIRAKTAWVTLLISLSVSGPAFASTAPFAMYDNMFYRGKPSMAQDGFVVSNILYEGVIWPHNRNYGVLPNRAAFEAMVRAHNTNPGPLVIDIEELPLRGTPDVAQRNMETLATLADWAHAAAPGKIIGFYGSSTLTRVAPADMQYARELAKHVDALFPPIYTFDDDRAAWEKLSQAEVAEAHDLAPTKPVYCYMWPQYHNKTAKEFQFVDAAYWTFELEVAARNCNGIVFWSPSKFAWDDATGWWSATQLFARKRASGNY